MTMTIDGLTKQMDLLGPQTTFEAKNALFDRITRTVYECSTGLLEPLQGLIHRCVAFGPSFDPLAGKLQDVVLSRLSESPTETLVFYYPGKKVFQGTVFEGLDPSESRLFSLDALL